MREVSVLNVYLKLLVKTNACGMAGLDGWKKSHWAFRLEHTLSALISAFIARALILPKLTATWQKLSSACSFYVGLLALNSKIGQLKLLSEPDVHLPLCATPRKLPVSCCPSQKVLAHYFRLCQLMLLAWETPGSILRLPAMWPPWQKQKAWEWPPAYAEKEEDVSIEQDAW